MHIQRLKSLLSCIIILKEELAYLVIALSLVTQHSPSLEGSIGPHRKTSLWLAVTRDGRRLTTPTFLQLTFFHCGFSWAEKSICIISRISYSEYNFFASRWELDSGTRTGYIFSNSTSVLQWSLSPWNVSYVIFSSLSRLGRIRSSKFFPHYLP